MFVRVYVCVNARVSACLWLSMPGVVVEVFARVNECVCICACECVCARARLCVCFSMCDDYLQETVVDAAGPIRPQSVNFTTNRNIR